MRRIMIDRARARKALKRPLPARLPRPLDIAGPMPPYQIIALNDALDRLAEINARAARITGLRYFAAMTYTESLRFWTWTAARSTAPGRLRERGSSTNYRRRRKIPRLRRPA